MWQKCCYAAGYIINKSTEIFHDRNTNDIVVTQDKKEIFRRPYEKRFIELAHLIYIGAKYKEDK